MKRVRTENPQETLVPDGHYRAIYVRCEAGWAYGRKVWFVLFQITEDGPHAGKLILRHYNVPTRPWLPRLHNMALDFEAVTGGLPPPADLTPDVFLKGCEVLVRTETVRHRIAGGRRTEIPKSRWYSKIAEILKITAGSPPCMPRKGRSGE